MYHFPYLHSANCLGFYLMHSLPELVLCSYHKIKAKCSVNQTGNQESVYPYWSLQGCHFYPLGLLSKKSVSFPTYAAWYLQCYSPVRITWYSGQCTNHLGTHAFQYIQQLGKQIGGITIFFAMIATPSNHNFPELKLFYRGRNNLDAASHLSILSTWIPCFICISKNQNVFIRIMH